jgi:hypothetical protein
MFFYVLCASIFLYVLLGFKFKLVKGWRRITNTQSWSMVFNEVEKRQSKRQQNVSFSSDMFQFSRDFRACVLLTNYIPFAAFKSQAKQSRKTHENFRNFNDHAFKFIQSYFFGRNFTKSTPREISLGGLTL